MVYFRKSSTLLRPSQPLEQHDSTFLDRKNRTHHENKTAIALHLRQLRVDQCLTIEPLFRFHSDLHVSNRLLSNLAQTCFCPISPHTSLLVDNMARAGHTRSCYIQAESMEDMLIFCQRNKNNPLRTLFHPINVQ